MLHTGRVRVSELIDQAHLRSALKDERKIHLVKGRLPVANRASRQDLEALRKRGCVLPPVGLEKTDDDVAALTEGGVAFFEHPKRLANSSGHAEKDLVPAATRTPVPAIAAVLSDIGSARYRFCLLCVHSIEERERP
jgi:hypothetical protein